MPEMPQTPASTAASHAAGAKQVTRASALCTQQASILYFLVEHAQEASDVHLWQPSCGRKSLERPANSSRLM